MKEKERKKEKKEISRVEAFLRGGRALIKALLLLREFFCVFLLRNIGDRVEIERKLAASLIAHAFFSTFPRRTARTHPTLSDFNFAGRFFQHLNR